MTGFFYDKGLEGIKMDDRIIKKAYERIFATILLENSPIKDIDAMLTDIGIPMVKEAEKNNWQLKDSLCLNFFYLLTDAKIERLSDEDREAIERIVDDDSEAGIIELIEIVKRTMETVMCINPEKKDEATCIGPYPDIKYVFDNDAIVLGFSRGNLYDENEALIESVLEDKCDVVIENLKEELLPMMYEETGLKICLCID